MSNKSLSAVFIAIAMLVWLFSGELSSNTVTAEEQPIAAEESPAPLVRGMHSSARMKRIELSVRGTTKANRVINVKSEITGKIKSLPAVKGTHVEKGDLLCEIAVDTRQSELNEARAGLLKARLEYDGIVDLGRRGLQSDIKIAQARASLETGRSNVRRAELALQKTRIIAPFSGIVDSQPVEEGDFLSPGMTCVGLMELDPILVIGHVAERSISAIRLGDEVDIGLITGERLKGVISYIARSPDTATRTYPIEVTVDNPGESIRAGLTSDLRVPIEEKMAHLISPASLVLNDAGEMGIKIVDQNSMVRFLPITILSESSEGVWVSGSPGSSLPPEINLITVGQEEVFDGQIVKIDLTPLASIVSY